VKYKYKNIIKIEINIDKTILIVINTISIEDVDNSGGVILA
jgi:hypothetical protein